MKIEQIYTGCLAQGAYFIESKGEAVVIDPLREVQPYLDKAAQRGVRIRYIFETHFHADFVSGHLDLAAKTGAVIVYGPTAQPGFEAHVAADGEVLKLGDVTFTVLHTPGHTMESTCYLLKDEQGKQLALFTGDTLFIGDVGRPDLAQKVNAGLTPELLAGHLYHSLREKIMPLDDALIIYPAHGAGSACGKMMSRETTDTLGHQKATNYALNPGLTQEAFLQQVLTGLTPPPHYFPFNVMMNIQGYDRFEEVLKRSLKPLEVPAFEAAANETGALILDTRDPQEFAKGFVPNAINIGLHGSFAPWVGTLITDIRQPLLLVTEEGLEEETVTRLSRVGYDHTIGYLKGGFAAWKSAGKEYDSIPSITAAALAALVQKQDAPIIDVRRKSEYDAEHLVQARNAPLDTINESMLLVDKQVPVYIHCASGYRSMIFASILKARGYDNLIEVQGGYKALKDSGRFPTTTYVRPLTEL
ncbi:MAG TPA: rhodanese-like domain-containing protein [Flavisolibacter sp.]|jgi:glyoxylase-like metal-dependent hydrolase (beta-lactamase superfamily II)/rhodanese-related sulfurtransferase|nr:rhodanese-like domain-containing protein [Flavisolibacter sp.]